MVQVRSSSEVTSEEIVSNRWEQKKLFDDLHITEICLRIRSSIRGDLDIKYSTKFLNRAIGVLRDRVRVWTPCTDVMDANILAMVHYTIELIHDELMERKQDSTESSKDEAKCCDNICPKCFP